MGHERDIVEKGFEQDRLDYWAMRDELLAKYAGKWVAVHKGRVIAVADEPLSIMKQALAEDGYAYTNKVRRRGQDRNSAAIGLAIAVRGSVVSWLWEGAQVLLFVPAVSLWEEFSAFSQKISAGQSYQNNKLS